MIKKKVRCISLGPEERCTDSRMGLVGLEEPQTCPAVYRKDCLFKHLYPKKKRYERKDK